MVGLVRQCFEVLFRTASWGITCEFSVLGGALEARKRVRHVCKGYSLMVVRTHPYDPKGSPPKAGTVQVTKDVMGFPRVGT